MKTGFGEITPLQLHFDTVKISNCNQLTTRAQNRQDLSKKNYPEG
jgi:hypothetical protein